MSALRFDRVTKRYGKRLALDALTFEIPRGSLAGFVGQNGAGKTTAYALVAGFLWADSGTIDLLGRGAFDPQRHKGLIGVLPQDAELPDRHSPRELLTHLARLQGLSAATARVEVDQVLDAVLLTDRRNSRIATLSHGMKRRVAIATALVGQPPLVLLDEPLSGLDPVQARAVREVLQTIHKTRTVVVSSHDLADLERLCDWVVMLKDGRCLRQGSLAQVTDRGRLVHWRLGPGEVPLERLAARLPEHRFEWSGEVLVQSALDGGLDESSVVVMEELAAARVPVREVQRGVALEQRFVDDVLGEALMDREELQRRVAGGEAFDYLLFWGHTSDGPIGATCLSQWYPQPFTLDGTTYPTAEHWMMAEKARLFDDSDALASVLAAATPAEAKQRGREVQDFDQNAWEAARFGIVVRGNVEKFGQTEPLKKYLLGTGDRVLVEASPRDTIWGIGLGRENPKARDPSQWRGLNLLGFALMDARTALSAP